VVGDTGEQQVFICVWTELEGVSVVSRFEISTPSGIVEIPLRHETLLFGELFSLVHVIGHHRILPMVVDFDLTLTSALEECTIWHVTVVTDALFLQFLSYFGREDVL